MRVQFFRNCLLLGVIAASGMAQITRSLLDGVTPPAMESGAAAGSYPLSGFESVNLFSGGLNVSLPLLKIGGRGEAGLVLSKTLETRWSTTRNQIGSGSDYFVYVNHGGASHGQFGYGPGFLEVRTDIKEDVCGANQIYHQQSLTRLHWNGTDGQDVDLVDKGTSGAAQGTGVGCGSGQLTGTLAYFNRGREFVSRNGSGVSYYADAPGGIKDNDGSFFPGLAQFSGTGSRIQANLGSAVSAMTTWRLELELRNVFPTAVNSIIWTSGGLSLSIEKNGASNYFLRFSGSGLNGQLTFNLSNSVTAPIIRIQRGSDGVYIAQCWDPADRTVPLPATASPVGWNNQAMTPWNFSSTPLYLGANASLTNNYQGGIDFVRFYNSTLISNDAPYLKTGSELYSYEFDANFNDSSTNLWHLTQATGVTLTSNVAATTGTLFFSNGMRIHTFNGRPDWIADRNGNRIQLYSENDVYQRITRMVDSVGRTVWIEYTNNPAHLGEEWIKFTGSGGTQRIVKVRHSALSSLLREAESVQALRQLFPQYSYSTSFPEVNSSVFNPILPSEVELPNGQKYAFQYNKFGELARLTLPTGGRFEYDWQGYAGVGTGAGVNGEFGDLLIYRRVKERRSYDKNATQLSLTRYDAPVLFGGSGDYIVSEVELTTNGTTELRRTRHSFHGHPIDSSFIAQFGYPKWREGRERQSQVSENATSTIARQVDQVWQQRNPANNASWVPSDPNVWPNDPRVVQVTTTLGTQASKQTMEYSLDEFNNLVKRCDFELAANASPTRCTTMEYETSPAYTALPVHLRGLVKKETIEGYSGSTATEESRSTYTFDNYGDTTGATGAGCPNSSNPQLLDRPGIVGMESERGIAFRCRGNVTKEERGVSGSVLSSSQRQYDIAGNVIKVIHPAVKTGPAAGDLSIPETVVSYNDSFTSSPGVSTFAFPTTITHPGGLMTSVQYHYGLGAVHRFTLEKAVEASGPEQF